MIKNEQTNIIDSILNLGQKIIPLLLILSFIYVFYIVPTYPKIDKTLPYDVISNKIEEVVLKNISYSSLEYSSDSRKLLKFRKAVYKSGNNMDKCKTKECLVDEYENFMDDWASTQIKQQTRYYYLMDLGIIGEILITMYKDLMR
ncbi:hypothetical protein ACNSOO_08655 [Aliarcobacter lanthieri]|uniref:hypothetical protein n=1 Tax=Aliarcobacter lanthieri TaxID=1355374 RepID=UPI00047B87B3|nr:hypothetical protein [Aliarcobacter lanthieri]QKF59139.1 hypothetical protein ALANTH_1029 [Aliarcobacter lanthieri]